MDPSRVEEEQDSPPGNGEATEEKPTLVAQRLNEKDEKPNALESDGSRVVLLVTAPLGHSFRSIVRVIGREPPSSPPFDWESQDNNTLPDLASRVKFTTHYALCVIDSEVWDSPSQTLLGKFLSAKFWDHPGEATMLAPSGCSTSNSSTRSAELNAGIPWSEDHIRAIDSGQEIGRTNMSDEGISGVYRDLRRDWMYMPVFWNCHDLAIRLGHLVISPSVKAVKFLRRLILSLQQAYDSEVRWKEMSAKVTLSGWCTAAVGSFVPPLAPIGVGVFMTGWCTEFFGRLSHDQKECKKNRYIRELEERFPDLRALRE